jgi:hypothetical protein
MTNKQLNWLIKIKNHFYDKGVRDLYDIIYLTLSNNQMKYLSFLKMISEGDGFFPNEGTGFTLDNGWDDPSDFKEVIFYLGEYESSTLSPQHFVELMQIISNSYIETHPKDKDSIEFYMNKLRERYSK